MSQRLVTASVRVLRQALALERASSPTDRRHAGVARGVLSALAARGLAMVVALVTVPLAVSYLGTERYGAWMTIQSFLAWFTIADLGLGNGLANALSAAYGRGDRLAAREAVATTFWMLAAVAGALLLTGAVVWRAVDWGQLLNVRSPEAIAEVRPAMGLALVFFCLAFPLGVVDRVYASLQEGEIGNAWGVVANLASLAALVVAVRTRGGLPLLVAAVAGTGLLVRILNAAWLFARSKPYLRPNPTLVTRASVARFSARGSEFFLVQIAALVLFSTDNIIIARVLGSEHVTSYSVTWRLLSLTNIVTGIAFPYLWAAYGEALARSDGAWVARTLQRSVVASACITAVLLLPMMLFGQSIIRAWTGPAAVPPHGLVLWMGAWFFMQAPANAIAAFLNAAGQMRVQVWAGLGSAVANLVLSVAWARTFGPTGVIAATVVSYGVLAAIPTTMAARRTAKAILQQEARA